MPCASFEVFEVFDVYSPTEDDHKRINILIRRMEEIEQKLRVMDNNEFIASHAKILEITKGFKEMFSICPFQKHELGKKFRMALAKMDLAITDSIIIAMSISDGPRAQETKRHAIEAKRTLETTIRKLSQ